MASHAHDFSPPHDHGHDDHGHGHLVLQYQPALPISKGKLCLWLFLSTEIMFFAGLIGTYIVLRFGAPEGTWPIPSYVHLAEWIGAVNTFVLLMSSVTIVLSLEAARSNKPAQAKVWFLATFLLGCVFLGVKTYEYGQKFSHGIYPAQPHSLIYEKPDLYYVQAVRQSLAPRQLALATEQAALQQKGEKLSGKKQEQLALYDNLLANLVRWTELKAAKEGDPLARRLAIARMAESIYPLREHGPHSEEQAEHYVALIQEEGKLLEKKLSELQSARSTTGSEKTAKTEELGTLQSQIMTLQKQRDELGGELKKLEEAAKPAVEAPPAAAEASTSCQEQPAPPANPEIDRLKEQIAAVDAELMPKQEQEKTLLVDIGRIDERLAYADPWGLSRGPFGSTDGLSPEGIEMARNYAARRDPLGTLARGVHERVFTPGEIVVAGVAQLVGPPVAVLGLAALDIAAVGLVRSSYETFAFLQSLGRGINFEPALPLAAAAGPGGQVGGRYLSEVLEQGASGSGQIADDVGKALGGVADSAFSQSARNTTTRALLESPKTQRHHVFPRKFREVFERSGIDIDAYTVELSQGQHLQAVHGVGNAISPGRWNQAWQAFLRENPSATDKDMYQFAGRLMDNFGMSGLPLLPYR